MAGELRAMVGARARTPTVTVRIATGELIDKLTVLQIEAEQIWDPLELKNVRAELAVLADARDPAFLDPSGLGEPTTELRSVNEALWAEPIGSGNASGRAPSGGVRRAGAGPRKGV